MPAYEYLCKSCGKRFEVWQHMTDEPLTTCPTCHGSVRRLLFPAGIVFKGSGFYKTDHPSSSHPSANGHSEAKKSAAAAPSDKSSANGASAKAGSGELAAAGAGAKS